MPRRAERRRAGAMVAAVALVSATFAVVQAVGVNSAHASATSIFDIQDGAIVSDASPPPDWSSIFACATPMTNSCQPANVVAPGLNAIAQSFVPDALVTDPLAPGCPSGVGNGDPTVFPGNNKNGQTLTTMQYGSGSVPGKDDLSNVYTMLAIDPATGHRIIYFGLERPAGNGDSHVDFEFFHSPVGLGTPSGLDQNGCPTGKWTGTRSIGDVLVSVDFTNGGTTPGLTVYTWNGTDYAVDTSPTLVAGAVANAAQISCGTWDCRTSTGGHLSSTVDINNFTEGYLDIDSPGLPSASCLSSFDAHTRSSQSFDAELEDFALGSFTTCDANIQISPNGVNAVGGTHTFTSHVNVKTTGAFQNAPDGTTINFTNSGAGTLSASSCQTSGGTGSCSVTETSNSAGMSTVNASTDVTVAPGVTLHRTTDGIGSNSGPAVKRWVDASVGISSSSVNEVNHPHTFVVTVTAIPSGTTPTFTSITPVVNPTPDVTNTNTCDSPTVNGNTATCTVTVNSSTVGTFSVDATAVVSFADSDVGATPSTATVTRSTSGTSGPGGTGTVTKKFVDATITIGQSGVNAAGTSHTFSITVTALPGGTGTPTFGPITTTVTPTPDLPGSTTCDGPTALSSTVETCTLTINNSTAGTFTANASATVTMGGVTVTRSSGDTNAGDGPAAVKTYVDAGISITPSAVNEVGNPHTFTVTVTAIPGTTSTAGFGPITATVSPTPDSIDASSCATPTTTATTATCSITIDNNTAGTFTANASDTVTFTSTDPNAVPLTATVTPSTAGNSGPGGTGPATKHFVDANVSISPSGDNEVGSPHVFAITVNALPGGAGTPSFDSITPNVTPTPGSISSTCSNPTISINGLQATCTVTINSTIAGTFTANATALVTIGGVQVSRTTGDAKTGDSGPAVKHYVDATITISPSGVNEVGNQHVFAVTVTASPGGASGVSFDSITPTVTPAPDTLTTTCAHPTVVSATVETCTVTINNPTAGTFTANATALVTMGSVQVTRSTGDTHAGDGPAAVKTYVDANITIAPNGTNGIGEAHIFTITFTAIPAGATTVFGAITPSVSPTPSTHSTTCAHPTVVSATVETCTLTINSNTAGVFTANATGVVTMGGVQVTRSTGDTHTGDGAAATKTYVSGSIRWVKHDANGNLLGGATFSLCQTQSYSTATNTFTTLGSPVCVTVLDNSAPDTDATNGNFLVTGLFLGTYTITETAAPSGYLLDPTVQTTHITTGSPDSDLSSSPYVNLQPGHAKVVKTYKSQTLVGTTQQFTFQLRSGASATAAGTVLETLVAQSSNAGVLLFTTSLIPGQFYEMCEQMLPGFMTTLGPPLYSVFNPSGDNSVVCNTFGPITSGQLVEFDINNTPPPGGMALTIGFWKNWASCASSNGKQKPVLDQTLLAAANAGHPITVGTLVLNPNTLGAHTACVDAVDILNKTAISSGKKMSSDPAFNLAAQLLAAEMNVQAGAGVCTSAVNDINSAQSLLAAIHFNGSTHDNMTAAQITQANTLQTALNNYNNNTLC